MTDAGTLIVIRPPVAALRGLVHRIGDYALATPLPMLIAPADLVVPVIVNLAARWSVAVGRPPGAADRWDSFVGGLTAQPVRMPSDASTHCLQIDLTPVGALRLFGGRLGRFADGMVALGHLGDPRLSELAARLAALPTAPARLDLVEAALMQWLRSPADPRLEAAAALLATGRAPRIAELADRVNLCRQQLARRMTAAFGLPPRTLARIGRFQRARQLAATGQATGWADLAALAGYADQAHLSRDFAALGGASPGRWPV
jgi:AraC-like DNA-binding protein